MVLWKYQSHVVIKDAVYATKIARSLVIGDYPDFYRISTAHLMWCHDFISQLVGEGWLSVQPGSEGERLSELQKLIADRKERHRLIEAERAHDQLEAAEEPNDDYEESDDELEEMMHQAAIEDMINAMPGMS